MLIAKNRSHLVISSLKPCLSTADQLSFNNADNQTITAFFQKPIIAFVVLLAQFWPQSQSAPTSCLPIPDTSLRC